LNLVFFGSWSAARGANSGSKAQADGKGAAAKPTKLSNLRVLVVDDNKINAKLVSRIVESEGAVGMYCFGSRDMGRSENPKVKEQTSAFVRAFHSLRHPSRVQLLAGHRQLLL
jgi:CheY-like chemotaxis protein